MLEISQLAPPESKKAPSVLYQNAREFPACSITIPEVPSFRYQNA